MEKGNGGEKKVEAEKASGGEKKVAVETGGEKKVEVGDGAQKKPAAPVCFKKTAAEDATLVDTTKGYFKQLQVTSADTHWACIKNRARLAKEYVAEKTSSSTKSVRILPLAWVDFATRVARTRSG